LKSHTVDIIVAGRILRETIINNSSQISIDRPGGNALYAAAGINLWRKKASIVAKISEDFPESKLDDTKNDIQGIKKVPAFFDQRFFYTYDKNSNIIFDHPQKYFFQLDRKLPKLLLGYAAPRESEGVSKKEHLYSITHADIPVEYHTCNNLLICQIDHYSHNILPSFYRLKSNGRIFMVASAEYMHPAFWIDIPPMIRGSEVFITSEDLIRKLFLGKSNDLVEMAEQIASFGVELVIISDPHNGQILFEASTKNKYRIPQYPFHDIDRLQALSAFTGGFCAGYVQSFNPLLSVLKGNITQSIKCEGSTPQFILDCLPELRDARLDDLKEQVIHL